MARSKYTLQGVGQIKNTPFRLDFRLDYLHIENSRVGEYDHIDIYCKFRETPKATRTKTSLMTIG